ncbi:MAG: hypothetical protein ACLP9L_29520 [Thermoguttaceae bacterium]
MDHKEFKEFKDRQALKARWGRQEIRGRQAQPVRKGHKANQWWERREQPAPWAQLDQWAQPGPE